MKVLTACQHRGLAAVNPRHQAQPRHHVACPGMSLEQLPSLQVGVLLCLTVVATVPVLAGSGWNARPQRQRMAWLVPCSRPRNQEHHDFNLDNFVSFDSEDEWDQQVCAVRRG